MNFVRDRKTAPSACSFRIEIDTTHDRIAALFGEWDETGPAYPEDAIPVILRHKETGHVYTIYGSRGEYRVGARLGEASRLGELLELVEPRKYAGLSQCTEADLYSWPIVVAGGRQIFPPPHET